MFSHFGDFAAQQLSTLQDQHSVIFHRLPHLLRSPAGQHVRLVVLDSITALFRAGDSLQFDDSDAAAAAAATAGTFSSSAAAAASLSATTFPAAVVTSGRYLSQRAIEFFKLSAHLRRLSAEHNMPIVIVNQVTDLFEPDARGESSKSACSNSSSSVAEFTRHQARRSSSTLKLPALGLAWANCVNARIFLTRGSVSRPVPAPVPAPASTAQHVCAHSQHPPLEQQAQKAQPQHCDQFELDAETEAAMLLLADAADADGIGGGSCSDSAGSAEEAPATIGATEPLREMHVIFSPLAPMRATRFTIALDGVRGIPLD